MEQRGTYAAVRDAQTMCALGTEQSSSDAATKDVQIVLSKEESALGMEQRGNHTYAAAKDVRIKFRKEECAEGTDQRSSNAAVKDV